LNITFPNPAGGYLALASPGGHLTPAPCPDTCCLIIDFKSYPNKKKSILGPLKCFPQLLSTYNLESKAACKIMLKLIHVKHCFQIHSWPYSLSTFSSHSVFLCLKFVTNNLENYCKFFLSFSFDCCFLFKNNEVLKLIFYKSVKMTKKKEKKSSFFAQAQQDLGFVKVFFNNTVGPRYMRSFYLWFRVYLIEKWPFFWNLSSNLQ